MGENQNHQLPGYFAYLYFNFYYLLIETSF